MAQARALAKACRPAPNRGRTAHDPHPGRQSPRAQRRGHEADARVLHRRARAPPPRPLPDARRAGGVLQGARRRAARGDLPDAPARRREARRGDVPGARHLGRGARRHDAMTARIRFPHEYAALDPAVRREIVDCFAADGLPTGAGILYLPPRKDPDVAVLAMHPRVDFFRHYLVPRLVGAGYAFLGAPTRNLNNDADALHERLLLDVAGNVAWLRERGFRRVVLLGNSGGGSLFAFYLAQAGKPPAERLARAPSGDRVPLGEVEMPMADGLVLLAAHLGEGVFLLDRLDPSVIDEASPTAVNPRLDMYDPRNGYRPMAEGASRYSADFLAEFGAAPARLDLLLRPRPDRRQLRRGARARHEPARVAVDLVGPAVERGARADAVRGARADARHRRARRHRHLSLRVPARVRGVGGTRQDVRGAGGGGSLPPARRRRRSEARGPEGSRRGRAHPAVARRALAGLKAHERLSIGPHMLRRWSLEEDVRHLERLGFRSISLASTKLGAYGVERAIRLL